MRARLKEAGRHVSAAAHAQAVATRATERREYAYGLSYGGYLANFERGSLSRSDGPVVVRFRGAPIDSGDTFLPLVDSRSRLPGIERRRNLRVASDNQQMAQALRSEQAIISSEVSGRALARSSSGSRQRRHQRRRLRSEAANVPPPGFHRRNWVESPVLDAAEEELVREVMEAAVQDETFGSWLSGMPIMAGANDELQTVLDELATAVAALGESEKESQRTKRQWRVLARDQTQVSARDFNLIWKSYVEFTNEISGVKAKRSSGMDERSPTRHRRPEPWHVAAATTFGQSLCTELNNVRMFDRRERQLLAAKRRVDEAPQSVWADPLPITGGKLRLKNS